MITTEHEGFLKAICADPRDVGLRLIYADWLEEHGEEARAEFVRVQCEMASFKRSVGAEHLPHAREEVLRRRECELQPSESPWSFPYGFEGMARWQYRRGFVEAIECSCADWLRLGPRIVRAQPVCEVKLTDQPIPAGFPATIAGNPVYIIGRGAYMRNLIAWARGPHPERGLTALPPLEDTP